MKKFISRVLVVAMVVSLAAMPVSATVNSDWSNWVKQKVHEIADIYRGLGYGENSAAIRLNQLIWAQADGKDIAGSYLYDSTTGQTYYLGTPSGGVVDGDYFDGQYNWFWNSSSQRYYRYDRNGSKVWGTGSRVGNTTSGIDTTSTYTAAGSNLSNYNYAYKNVKLYAGRIYGLKGFDTNEVETLAKLIKSYSGNQDLLRKSAFAWSVHDLQGSNTLSYTISKYYEYYDAGAAITEDDREFAREMLFRFAAEKSGNTYVGRTLPTGYGWVYDDGAGNLYFRQSKDGANYAFPNAYGTGQYRSPYHN